MPSQRRATPDAPVPLGRLGRDEARVLALQAQGLLDGAARPRTVPEVLRALGAVQLDTISALARSHELVAYARLGSVPRAAVEAAYWGAPARTFEYLAHANCIIPLEAWPYFAFRRRVRRAAATPWMTSAAKNAVAEVRARLREGPVTTSDLGGARDGPSGWWNWSGAKRAVEWLYQRGDVVCTDRRGWKRVYDLPERVIPPDMLAREPSGEECYRFLVAAAIAALGVATRADIAAYFRLTGPSRLAPRNGGALLDQAIDACGLVPVQVEGWDDIAYARPESLAVPAAGEPRTALLSPFDSLVWAPARVLQRTERLFGFTYQLEAYVPKEKRTHGYFVMPLLADGRIVGRADPVRRGSTLVVSRVSLEDRAAGPAMAAALREAASWVGCDTIVVESVSPRGAVDVRALAR